MQRGAAGIGRRFGVPAMVAVLLTTWMASSAAPAAGFGSSAPPPGPPTVSTGGYMTCGIRASDSNAVCWGNNVDEGPGQATPPPGVTFTEVNAGYNLACGVKTDTTLACWGSPASGGNAPLTGTFTHVAAGFNFACGLRTDATVACWGDDTFGQVTDAPEGTYTQLSVGIRFGCALNAGEITCWGDDTFGQGTVPVPPVGVTYSSVATGNFDTCAIRSDGVTDCWGRNVFGQDNVPAGTFIQVNPGFGHVCARKADQTIVCWGRNLEGQAMPPPGTYNDVSAGTFTTCAMSTTGRPVCWGNNAAGRVRPIIKVPTTDATGSFPPPIVIGVPYSHQFQTSYVSPSLVWSVNQGSLPPGLTLTSTGLLSGTPTGSGHFSFTLSAGNGFTPSITKSFMTNRPTVFRPATGLWYVQGGPVTAWGTNGDISVPADYDGDGDDDIAVFRPSSGIWYVNGGPSIAWGTNGDVPVPADYDGDGADDIAVFRPASGIWYVDGGIAPTGNTGYSTPTPSSSAPIAWGTNGDVPVPADYDNNGIADIAVFRPSIGQWFLRGSIPDFTFGPNRNIAWGTNGDIPVPADYDFDGDTDIAVFRPSTGAWYPMGSNATGWGTNGDQPRPGHYNA